MLYTGLDHPAIACYDVETMADWYCRTLGMRVVMRNPTPPLAVMVGYHDDPRGGAMIELMPVREPGPTPKSTTRFQPGIRHVALRVSNFDEAYGRLQQAGVEFLMEPTEAIGGGRVVSFRDPEGNELQIIQR